VTSIIATQRLDLIPMIGSHIDDVDGLEEILQLAIAGGQAAN
jgi:hypothetical protein